MHRHDAAVNALVVGTKKWFLFPPTQQNWGPDAFGMPVLQWVETVLPKLKEQGGQAATEQLRGLIPVTRQHHPPTRRTLVSGELA